MEENSTNGIGPGGGSNKSGRIPNYSPSSRIALVLSVTIIGLVLILGGCKSKDKPLSLGYFTEISGLSISKDGNNLLFTGCGHKDYQPCTIYRYEMVGDKLYRYMPRTNAEALHGGRYSPVSDRFAFIIFPLNQKVTNKENLGVCRTLPT